MHSRPNPALILSFSGIDGAGKSSQIDHLSERLRAAGLRVELLRFWDDVATLKSIREAAAYKLFKGEKGVGTPEAPVARRDKNIRSPWMTGVRLGIYLLDALALRLKAAQVENAGADVIIFDRYIYDGLANLNLENRWERWYARSILASTPHPGIAFVMDADPVRARARKPEYPLEFIIRNRDSYLRLSELAGDIEVIPPLQLEDAKLEVWRRIASRLPARVADGNIVGSPGGKTAQPPEPTGTRKQQERQDGASAHPARILTDRPIP